MNIWAKLVARAFTANSLGSTLSSAASPQRTISPQRLTRFGGENFASELNGASRPGGSAARKATRSHIRRSAILVLATTAIINAIAVANVEAALAAVCPDRVLDEPGKGLRKRWIELPGIDPLSDGLNNVGAAAGPRDVGQGYLLTTFPL